MKKHKLYSRIATLALAFALMMTPLFPVAAMAEEKADSAPAAATEKTEPVATESSKEAVTNNPESVNNTGKIDLQNNANTVETRDSKSANVIPDLNLKVALNKIMLRPAPYDQDISAEDHIYTM